MMIPLGCSVPKNSSQFTNKKQKMRGNYIHLFLSPIKPKIDNVLEQLHTLAPSPVNSSCTVLN